MKQELLKCFFKWVLLITGIAGALLFAVCQKPLELSTTINPDDFKLQVTDLRAGYDRSNNLIVLNWTALDPSAFSFYRIERTVEIDIDSNADTNTYNSDERRKFISNTSSSFNDIVGLANSRYFYRLTAFKVINGKDTVQGERSNVATVDVGAEVSFSINYGDLFVVRDSCVLVINDPSGLLDHIWLTQYTKTFFKKNNDSIEVNLTDPTNPPTAEELAALVSKDWITSGGALNTNSNKVTYPDFSRIDFRNPERTKIIQPGLNIKGWKLLKGSGKKTVFARLFYKDGRIIETSDEIAIRPYKVEIIFRNDTTSGKGNMTDVVNSLGYHTYMFSKPVIEFSLDTKLDSSFNLAFDYWILLPEGGFSYNIASQYSNSPNGGVLEASPVKGLLTGYGVNHSITNVYRYDYSPVPANAYGSLARLHKTIYSSGWTNLWYFPTIKNVWIFQPAFFGQEPLNELCSPGSYFGDNPKYWKDNVGLLADGQSVITGTPSELFSTLTYLGVGNFVQKEFMLIVRMKGRYFDDVRTIVSRTRDTTSSDNAIYSSRACVDFFVPTLFFLTKPDSIFTPFTNKSVISGPFSFSLNINNTIVLQRLNETYNSSTTPSLLDASKITEVSLLIARMPDSMATVWSNAPTTRAFYNLAQSVTIEQLNAMNHVIIPDTMIAKADSLRTSTLSSVRWPTIDPTTWPSGDYLFAIIAADKLGNRNLARCYYSSGLPYKDTASYTNPMRVKILTNQ